MQDRSRRKENSKTETEIEANTASLRTDKTGIAQKDNYLIKMFTC